MPSPGTPFRYLHSLPEEIRLMAMMYVRFPLPLRNVEDLLFERYRIYHETVRIWQNRVGPMFAGHIRLSASSRGSSHLSSTSPIILSRV